MSQVPSLYRIRWTERAKCELEPAFFHVIQTLWRLWHECVWSHAELNAVCVTKPRQRNETFTPRHTSLATTRVTSGRYRRPEETAPEIRNTGLITVRTSSQSGSDEHHHFRSGQSAGSWNRYWRPRSLTMLTWRRASASEKPCCLSAA